MAYLTQFSGSVPLIKFPINQTVMTIGQDIEMDICVPEDGIAANHAMLEVTEKNNCFHFIIKSQEDESLIDLNSDSISHAELKDGDWLIIGGVEFQFTDDGINDFTSNVVSIKPNEKPAPKDSIKATEDKEEKLISTKEFIEDSRFSRRLNRF